MGELEQVKAFMLWARKERFVVSSVKAGSLAVEFVDPEIVPVSLEDQAAEGEEGDTEPKPLLEKIAERYGVREVA